MKLLPALLVLSGCSAMSFSELEKQALVCVEDTQECRELHATLNRRIEARRRRDKPKSACDRHIGRCTVLTGRDAEEFLRSIKR